jgi:DNA topoisomerase-2
MVSDGEIGLIGGKVSRHEASQMLSDRGFNTAADLEGIRRTNSLTEKGTGAEITPVEEDPAANAEQDSDHDYLLQMPLFSLTREKIESLNQEAQKIEDELKTIRAIEPEELWMHDLDKLAKHL